MTTGAENAVEGMAGSGSSAAAADGNIGRGGDRGGDTRGKLVRLPSSKLPTAEQAESVAWLSIAERLALDPSADIGKLQQILDMRERIEAKRARAAYDAAFSSMQPELPEIDKRGKIIIKEKGTEKVIQSTLYALWDDTNRLIKPILAKHGFALSFRIAQTDARLTTTAVLAHEAGHREETSFSAPIDSTGSKNNVQGWGSSFSYGKRYTGTALLNITTKGEDDDGKAAGDPATITDEQAKLIEAAIEFKGIAAKRFCGKYKIQSIADLPAAQYDAAMKAVQEHQA